MGFFYQTYRNVALVLLPARGMQHVQINKVHLTAHAQNPTRESFAKMVSFFKWTVTIRNLNKQKRLMKKHANFYFQKEMHASFLPVKMAEDAK